MSGDATVPERSVLNPTAPDSPKAMLRFLTELRALVSTSSSTTEVEAKVKELTFLTY